MKYPLKAKDLDNLNVRSDSLERKLSDLEIDLVKEIKKLDDKIVLLDQKLTPMKL